MAQANFAQYGLDEGELNYGKNIFESYNTRTSNYGNITGQGIETDLSYMNGRIAFIVNPKTNLRVEVGGILRQEKNTLRTTNTNWLTLGLRSSFRNIYSDF